MTKHKTAIELITEAETLISAIDVILNSEQSAALPVFLVMADALFQANEILNGRDVTGWQAKN
ncbi:MAG: hypothetical protein ACOYLR_00270 [Chlorobium sp.]